MEIMRIDSKKVVSKYLEYVKRKEKNNEKPMSSGDWLWHVMDLLNVEDILTDDAKLPHEEIGYMLWREKPLGTGESSVIIIPLDRQAKNAIWENLNRLCKIFDSSIDSKETIKFRVEELDWEDVKGDKQT